METQSCHHDAICKPRRVCKLYSRWCKPITMAQVNTTEFLDRLWSSAEKLRMNLDAATYKHVVLGLVFLKHISDKFDERFRELTLLSETEANNPQNYSEPGLFWMPYNSRWIDLKQLANNPKSKDFTLGKRIDKVMHDLEKNNPALDGILPKNYAEMNKHNVKYRELFGIFDGFDVGGRAAEGEDILGEVFEFFLGKFALSEGARGGQYYTPKCVVELIVNMLRPKHGVIYDPCCGSGGMFTHSHSFNTSLQGGSLKYVGQESNHTTWRLFKQNMAIRGIPAETGKWGSTFTEDRHKKLEADYIIANPPFNLKDWEQPKLISDPRWKFGVPPANNANFAWIQHMLARLSDNGSAGFVLSNGSLDAFTKGEGEIRQAIVDADLVDCIVTLPDKLFYNTPIPACLWFLSKNKEETGLRSRKNETLFIDCRDMGVMENKKQRVLTEKEIVLIASTYGSWRGDSDFDVEYTDVPGFCKSANLQNIVENRYKLVPGRFVGIESLEVESDDSFDEKMNSLISELGDNFAKSNKLQEKILADLRGFGYEH
jgi:type I restriction enzyme M protein